MAKFKRKPKKATNKIVDIGYLRSRASYLESGGFKKSKWIVFCEEMLRLGLVCELYEARQTVSKYITVRLPEDRRKSFKVRFSDHKPIYHRELEGHCDFFVGRTNLKITTTQQAIAAACEFFSVIRWALMYENMESQQW